MSEVVMPRLSDSMEEGTILTWLKQVGDEVAVGDELVEVETDKANMAYESDVAGTLTEILAQEGDTLASGSPIAVVGDAGEARPGGEAPPKDAGGLAPGKDAEGSASQDAGPVTAGDPPSLPVAEASSATVPPTAPPAAQAANGERVKASPLARRIARDMGVDLAGLTGSGPGGRSVKSDVEKAGSGTAGADAPQASPSRAEVPSPSTPQLQSVGVDGDGTHGGAGETAMGRTTVQEL